MGDWREEIRAAAQSNPEVIDLIDPSVKKVFELTDADIKVLVSILLEGPDEIATRHYATSRRLLTEKQFYFTLEGLEERGLVVQDGAAGLDASPFLKRLRVTRPEEDEERKPTQPPRRNLVFKPVRQLVVMMAREGNNSARALAEVYSFLYGKPERGPNFGVLGKIANLLGRDRAALFLLEHCHRQFEGDPLKELLPLAIGLAGWREEKKVTPDDKAQAARDRQQWLERMERWRRFDLIEEGGIAFKTPEQREADERQRRLDFRRWEQEQREGKV